MDKDRCVSCGYSSTIHGYLICDYIGCTGKARTVKNGVSFIPEGECDLFIEASDEHIRLVKHANRKPYIPPESYLKRQG